MKITISDFQGYDVTVDVASYIPFSDIGARARPGSSAWAEPPEGELIYCIETVDTGMQIGDCDPEDNVVPVGFIKQWHGSWQLEEAVVAKLNSMEDM